MNKFCGEQSLLPPEGKKHHLNYLLIALETGFFWTILSSSGWGQVPSVDHAPEDEQDPSPDQPVPKLDVDAAASVRSTISAPEATAPVAFSGSRSASEPVQPPVRPRPTTPSAPTTIQFSTASPRSSSAKSPPPKDTATSSIRQYPSRPATAGDVLPPLSTSVPTVQPEIAVEPTDPVRSHLPTGRPEVLQQQPAVDVDIPPAPTSQSLEVGYSTEARDLLSPKPESSLSVQFSPTAASSPNLNPAENAQDAGLDTDPQGGDDYRAESLAIPPGSLDPLVTTIPLNGVPLPYETQGEISAGVSAGDERSTNIHFRGLYTTDRVLEASTNPGNVMTLAQQRDVFQVQDVLQERLLRLSANESLTVLSQTIQLSLTGTCLENPGSDGAEICTYTPGLVTDRNSVDPNTLLPTQFEQTSNFGDIVTPESLAAIREPGFQQGANGQIIGLDLYFPNIGTIPDANPDSRGIFRDEQLVTTPAISFTDISQTVQGNANEASLTRMIRGPAIVLDADQPITNFLLAAAALLLPEVQASVPETAAAPNPNINSRLFVAANNTRLPVDSLTLYQAGLGYSPTPQSEADPQNPSEVIPVNFNTVWLGLSPVTERSYAVEESFEATGEQRLWLAAGGEGGGADAPEVNIVVNGELYSSTGLNNVYTQNYVSIFEQDAFLVSTFQQTERIRYYPHLTFSGNITGLDDVFRYYAGAIAGPTLQAYGGLDYQRQTSDGWFYQAGALGFINPNYDRYSNLSGGIARRMSWGEEDSLALGTSFNWALDQDTQLGDIEQEGLGSDISLQARLNLGAFSIGALQVVGDILPNSQPSRTVLDTAIKLGKDFVIAGFWAPFDNATTAPQLGVSANVGLHIGDLHPHLVFSWQNTRYNYGQDSLGNALTTASDTFEIFLRMEW